MTGADAKGYFSLFFAFSPISFLLCLIAFTPPEFSNLSLLSVRIVEILACEMELNNSHHKYAVAVKNL